MASRLLSSTLQARTGLSKQFVRPFASAAKQGAVTRTTILSNGFTVATEENSSAGAATVGVWIDAGSRLESAQTHGVANLLGRLALNGKASSLEKLGGVSNAGVTREQTFFATKTLGSNVSESVAVLGDLVQNVDSAAIDSVRGSIVQQQEAQDAKQIVFDHLYATAFQGEALGRPVSGYKETLESLTAQDVNEFHKQNYAANKMVLVGAGDVDHDALVREAEKVFGGLAHVSETAVEKPAFTGSEIRLRDDVLPRAEIAIAVEGAGYLTPEYFNLLVMESIIGSYDRTLSGAANLTSRLSSTVHKNHLADSFVSFYKAHKDTGLWGMYFATANRTQIDDFVHFLQKEWIRLSTTVTESEVEIAKRQVLGRLLLSQDSTCAVAQDIGNQVLAYGKRLSPEELKEKINKISLDDVRRTASKYLWDQEIAVVGYGPIEGLTDYNRVRGNMAYNRF